MIRLAWVVPVFLALPSPAPAASELDTLGLRIQIGTRADVSNEQYVEYQDAFQDTTFQVKQFVGTPESRVAAVLAATLAGTRSGRSTRYELANELSIGDLIRRDALSLSWRSRFDQDWTLLLVPRAEYRHDRTFDRDLEEWRAGFRGTLRRLLIDDLSHAEIGVHGDLLRASGAGSEFLLDRQTAGGSLGLEHFGILGDEWRVGYRLTGRVFPDSTERNHLEHEGEARGRRLLGSGWVAVEGRATRRTTGGAAPTTRDDFWTEEGSVEAQWPVGDDLALRTHLFAEAYQYEVQDTTLFFDYQILRGSTLLRLERASGWTLGLGPRAEVLLSRGNPAEAYREISGVLEFERIGPGSWWSLVPAVGWRDYQRDPAAPPGFETLHTAFVYYQLDAIANQALGMGLEIRGLVAARLEMHDDESQDARSLYGSIELRWSVR